MSDSAPQLSFEFFPPRSAAQQVAFERARDRLATLQPAYMSVTFGAGGSTRDRTRETVLSIAEATGIEAAPHISCMAESDDDIEALLDDYRAHGIKRLVVLRGDRPSGSGAGVFPYAVDLVRFIRKRYGNTFHIEVACYPEHHPESRTPDDDLKHFRDKVAAGADGAITQYFFSADSYFRFVDEARSLGVSVPIVPGIMPITNYTGLARFSQMCGAEIPLWIAKRLKAWDDAGDRESIAAFGEDVVTELCRRLLDGGAPGLHFYTLNRARATLALCRNLGLDPQPAATGS
ncbi:methylenetetrahydrofolate reductase [NAD(P)H] [Wenzhouxiangella sp. AB-CW3]|uniref:methylenetetrahydrofolate reductase [NAD(P)H] n=1 Tax=Wenzhouxiangella sp. AB-CW3 TaxID=2771012 RepID=UPI00168BBA97|nr:methylenetetrahydrofolate reductase [NAD(P)H] [Wenzhouxiangella sp. AB-CW3]QOC22146.1 methylenetetrahydrofolate reductase [NAD(P)H] [Wenzhouxiangella sp. AB-CW3]